MPTKSRSTSSCSLPTSRWTRRIPVGLQGPVHVLLGCAPHTGLGELNRADTNQLSARCRRGECFGPHALAHRGRHGLEGWPNIRRRSATRQSIPFYLHSYIFNFGLPFKHTGTLVVTHVSAPTGQGASGFGLAQYASYTLTDRMTVNGRLEYFRDDQAMPLSSRASAG